MELVIQYRNTEADCLTEKNLDCTKYTMMGHAGYLIDAWKKQKTGVYQIDSYNVVLLDEIISVTIKKKL